MTAIASDIGATRPAAPMPGDLCNLLQVAASALHLIDSQLDDDLRPLIRAGLAAICQAAGGAQAHIAATPRYLERNVAC